MMIDGPNIYFCDLMVYRLPREQYYSERERYVEKIMFPTEAHRQFYHGERSRGVAFKDHLVESYGGCWEYNETIGVIRLHFLGSQIRGEYFGVRARRIVRTRYKVFKYKTHKLAPEINIPGEATNAYIAGLVRQYVDDCRRELDNRYIDTEVLDRIAPHVDWRGLLSWS
jgi:hypothetical protein